MPRKKRTPTARRKRTTPRKLAARNPCRALLPVDQEPLRREALAGCRDVMHKLEKEEAKWRRFEEEDAPAFQRWYDKHFGKLESDVRREEVLIRERYELVDEVEFEFHYRGGGYRAAYRRVMEERENPDEHEDEEDEEQQSDDREARDAGEEAFRSFFRDVFGVDDEEMDEMFDDFRRGTEGGKPGSPPEPATTRDKSRSARVKERFRMLARKLHPDHRDDDNPRKTELWHEAQEAYNTLDLERLDTLLALSEVEDGEITEATGLCLLDRVRDRFQASLREIRSRLRRARKDPAWKFSRNPDTGKLAERIRSKLESALEENRRERKRLDALIAEWSQPPGRARAAAAKKKASRSPRRKRVAENDPRQPEFTFG